MNKIERTSWLIEKFQKFNFWLLIFPIAAMIIIFFLDAANVLTIRFFGFKLTPIQKELIEDLLVVVVFLPLAYVLLGPGHINTDMFKDRFAPVFRFFADMVSSLALIFLAVIGFLATGTGTLHALRAGSVKMGNVQFPLAPFYICLTSGFFLLIIAATLIMLKRIFLFQQNSSQYTGK